MAVTPLGNEPRPTGRPLDIVSDMKGCPNHGEHMGNSWEILAHVEIDQHGTHFVGHEIGLFELVLTCRVEQ